MEGDRERQKMMGDGEKKRVVSYMKRMYRVS